MKSIIAKKGFVAFFLAIIISIPAFAGDDKQFFTPAADLKGNWQVATDPKLPNVLIIGDSISIGYTKQVREKLRGKANVYHPMSGKRPDNCGDTRIGLKKIDEWLGKQKWNVIHFNWGLWDLCYRNSKATTQGNRDKINGTISVPLPDYKQNLEKLVARLEATGAVLIWANTTVVPEGEAGRFAGDEKKYNAVAAQIMKQHGIATDDLFLLTKQFAGKYSIQPGNVHYTKQGYARIATQVSATIENALPKSATKH